MQGSPQQNSSAHLDKDRDAWLKDVDTEKEARDARKAYLECIETLKMQRPLLYRTVHRHCATAHPGPLPK